MATKVRDGANTKVYENGRRISRWWLAYAHAMHQQGKAAGGVEYLYWIAAQPRFFAAVLADR